jgi:hypothetical protein
VLSFAMPFASLKSCAKMLGQNHFGGAKPACFDLFYPKFTVQCISAMLLE